MSKEQRNVSEQDRGELILSGVRIKNSLDMAAHIMVELPYLYLFSSNSSKNGKVEEFLNRIDPETELQHSILIVRVLETFFGEDSRQDIKSLFIDGGGAKFSKMGLEEGNPVILIDPNHEACKMSLVDGVFGTNKLRFTSDTLINIFETLVAVQKYLEGQKAA